MPATDFWLFSYDLMSGSSVLVLHNLFTSGVLAWLLLLVNQQFLDLSLDHDTTPETETDASMKNIGGGIAAPSFSAVGSIWLDRRPKKHVQQ